MNVKLLTEHHLEFLSLKGGCTGSSESTLVKMPNCWKSQALAQMFFIHRQSELKKTLVEQREPSLRQSSDTKPPPMKVLGQGRHSA